MSDERSMDELLKGSGRRVRSQIAKTIRQNFEFSLENVEGVSHNEKQRGYFGKTITDGETI